MNKRVNRREDLPTNDEPYSAITALYGRWDQFAMTKAAGLLGGIELSGVDPRTITEAQREGYSNLVRAAYQLMPPEIVATQYYFHFDNLKVNLKRYGHPRVDLLSARREKFLNLERNLSGSRLFHLLDVPAKTDLNKLASVEFLTHLTGALGSKKSRDYIKQRLSTKHALFATHENLREQVQVIRAELNQLRDRFSMASADNSVMSAQQLWALMRVLYTFDPAYFQIGLLEKIPSENWGYHLPDGDITHVVINRTNMLRLEGVKTRYARIASLTGYGEDSVEPGFWINGPRPPVMQPGNYIVMSRWRPLNQLERSMMFFKRRTELERSQLNFIDMMKGTEQQSALEQQAAGNQTHLKEMRELESAQAIKDRYGFFCSQVVLFDEDPEKLIEASTAMNIALTQAGGKVVWESRGLMEAYESFLPAYHQSYKRDAVFNSTQLGACSHLYRSTEGVPHWGHNNQHESWYIFESEDGTPFHFTPYVGGRMVILGVGPIRSGKTFLKNCIASHYQKFGGFFRAIDIDPGAEPIAEFFGDEAGIFRVEQGEDRGFNPFVSMRDENDHAFRAHFLSQLNLMLKANDNEDMQKLDMDEQRDVDAAISKTMRLTGKQTPSMSAFYHHLNRSTKVKFKRWVKDGDEIGMYAHLVDHESDAIGSFNKRIGTFNLAGVKDDPIAMPLVMNEIFYRVTRLFEDPALRHLPKFLDCDESHFLMKIRDARQRLVGSVRTWGKWFAGVGLWTQSATEFAQIEDFAALRSAASTMFFMADSQLDRVLYKNTFHLTEGELDAIANLVPKLQALIIQRELGISKVVNLYVETEQYVINTSVAHEADTRRMMMREFGDPDVAIARTIDVLGLRKQKE